MSQQLKQLYEFGSFRLVPDERRLFRDGESVALPPKEFDLLLLLVRSAGQPLGREILIKSLWPHTTVEEANLNVHVSALRKILADGSSEQHHIETMPRLGYRFVTPVTAVSAPEPAPNDSAAYEAIARTEHEEIKSARQAAADRLNHRAKLLGGLLLSLTLMGSLAGLYFYFFKAAGAKNVENGDAVLLNAVPLTTYPGRESQPAFSPDGNQFAFVWRKEDASNLDIYVRLLDGGNTIQLTSHPGDDVNPTWAPNGRLLAFYRSADTGDGIFVIPALGGAERKLTDVWANRFGFGSHTWLHWSPKGKWLAVSDKTASQEPFSLFLLSPETGEKRRLTTPTNAVIGDCSPAFSPDGNQLAFVRVLSAVVSEIFIVGAEGGAPRQLTFSGEGISNLAWTPDGRELVFASRYGGKHSLFRIPVEGGAARALSVGGNDAQYPAFSAQGNRLAWARNTDNTDIFRVALKGGGQAVGQSSNLIASTAIETSPRFAPDGKRIVFVSNRSGSDEIWVCGSAGENPIRLTAFRGPLAGSPSWSPDGKQLAFDCRPAGNADIFVVGSEGGEPRRLTTDAAEDIVPSWSNDGRWIYFTSQRSGRLQIWKIPAGGGAATQLTQQGGFDPLESPDGQWLYFTQERGSSAIWRMPVTGGTETPVFDFHQKNFSRLWTVSETGVFFAVPPTPARIAIRFFSFATGAEQTLAEFPGVLRNGVSGLSRAPDGSALLLPVLTQRGSDLMLLERFR